MAKKETKGATADKGDKVKGGAIVTVADLAEEFDMDPKTIRAKIRSLGFTAPEVEKTEGFGPRAKYEWSEDSEELKKIKAALSKAE